MTDSFTSAHSYVFHYVAWHLDFGHLSLTMLYFHHCSFHFRHSCSFDLYGLCVCVPSRKARKTCTFFALTSDFSDSSACSNQANCSDDVLASSLANCRCCSSRCHLRIYGSLERECRKPLRHLAASWPRSVRKAWITRKQNLWQPANRWCVSGDQFCFPPLNERMFNEQFLTNEKIVLQLNTYKPSEYHRHL